MLKTKLAAGALVFSTLFIGAVPAYAANVTQTTGTPGMPTVTLTVPGALSEDERASLLFMREEEKLAHDVYVTLYDQWGLRVFNNIAASEQKHTDAIAALLNAYGLTDPTIGNGVGEFTNPDLQALYDELVAQGSASVTEALKVGVAIEELDITDLEQRIAETDSSDIQRVYSNLLAGSTNHLRAFSSNLSRHS
ncbi:MAG: DUF2202 domain-containing protein [Anaerolineales bacterium]|nr:DUF2202 domain-containing protein [Anaerolineales bacterium]